MVRRPFNWLLASSSAVAMTGSLSLVIARESLAPPAAWRHPAMALDASSSEAITLSRSFWTSFISASADLFVWSAFSSTESDMPWVDSNTFRFTVEENPWLICRTSVCAAESHTFVATALYFSFG